LQIEVCKVSKITATLAESVFLIPENQLPVYRSLPIPAGRPWSLPVPDRAGV
jgi:hypothetical protein